MTVRFAGALAMVVAGSLAAAHSALAQPPGPHYWHAGAMPPGAIGSRQLLRGGPLPGFFQPVEIKAPSGVLISLAQENQFGAAMPAPVRAGLLIGQVYRLRVMGIALRPGEEVFPTIEVIDRLYAPNDQRWRFPIVIELTHEELVMALEGKFVTRVIYLEDPLDALPFDLSDKAQSYYDVGPVYDPLATADALGRPMAILRLGGRQPDNTDFGDPRFFFGSPPFQLAPPEVRVEGIETEQPMPSPRGGVEPEFTPAMPRTPWSGSIEYGPVQEVGPQPLIPQQQMLPQPALPSTAPPAYVPQQQPAPQQPTPALPRDRFTTLPDVVPLPDVSPPAIGSSNLLPESAPTESEVVPAQAKTPDPGVKVLPPPPRRPK